MIAATSSTVPSSQRPVPLKRRNDLVVERIEFQGVGSWVIKDPVGLKYHRLQGEQYCVLGLLDGQRSLEDIREGLKREFPTLTFTLADLQHLITDLHEKVLVHSNRPGQGAELIKAHKKARRKKILGAFKNLLYLRVPGWDPEPTLKWLYPLVSWMFRPWTAMLAALLVGSSLTLLAVQFDKFQSRLPEFQQFFGWPNLMYMWITLGIAKIIHEFGHGLSCKHYGGECHGMGLMFLVFSPCLYCDVSDSWMLKSKWQRIMIAAAGMYIEIILSAIALWVWWYTQPGLLHHLCLNIFFVTTVTTVIFNANPLMRFDGYYMMADFLEIPNLRPKSDRMLREKFAWYCLGIESRPDPFMPETGIVWFVMYAIAAAMYRWLILFGITLFLYTVLKPYDLQSIGITLAVVSVGGIIINMFFTVYRMISAPRSDPMSYPKLAATVAVLLCLVGAGIMVPLPLHVESAFRIEPNRVQRVFTNTPGRLTELRVQPGGRVQKGEILAKLSNLEIEDQYRALQVQKDVLEAQVDLYHVLDDASQEMLAGERLNSVKEQIEDYKKQLDDLTIVSPGTGIVIAPERVAEPELETSHSQLSVWFGTPLDPKNRGCRLDERTHLLSIAPNERLDAILLVDQADRNDIEVGQTVELKFDSLPDRTYAGVVSEFSKRNQDFVPTSLSNKGGGPLPTVTDAQGRERAISTAYPATVTLDEDVHLLTPGMRGRARFLVAERTAGDWIWRYFRRTFNFRL